MTRFARILEQCHDGSYMPQPEANSTYLDRGDDSMEGMHNFWRVVYVLVCAAVVSEKL